MWRLDIRQIYNNSNYGMVGWSMGMTVDRSTEHSRIHAIDIVCICSSTFGWVVFCIVSYVGCVEWKLLDVIYYLFTRSLARTWHSFVWYLCQCVCAFIGFWSRACIFEMRPFRSLCNMLCMHPLSMRPCMSHTISPSKNYYLLLLLLSTTMSALSTSTIRLCYCSIVFFSYKCRYGQWFVVIGKNSI